MAPDILAQLRLARRHHERRSAHHLQRAAAYHSAEQVIVSEIGDESENELDGSAGDATPSASVAVNAQPGSASTPSLGATRPSNRPDIDVAARRRRGQRGDEVVRAVVAQGPLTRREIHRAVGGSVGSVDKVLRRLCEGGRLVPDDASPRHYRVPADLVGAGAPSTLPEQVRSVDELLSLVRERGSVTMARLSQLTGHSYPRLAGWKHELLRRRVISVHGVGKDQEVRAIEAPELVARVAEIVTANPGQYNERQIALVLRAPEESIGEACGVLSDQRLVECKPDGTYWPLSDLRRVRGARR